jgi:hypothetical protein
LQAVVTDAATGAPVRGVTVGFSRQSGTALPVTLPRGTTDADGIARSSLITSTALTLTAVTTAVGMFNAWSGGAVAVTAGVCTAALTASADRSSLYYGDPVLVSGLVSHTSAGGNSPLAGAPLQITETAAGRVLALGRVTSAADGSFRAAVRPTLSGSLAVSLATTPSWTAAFAAAGAVSVSLPGTVLTAAASATDVGYGAPVTVSGTLLRDAGGSLTGLSGAMVSIRSTSGTGAVTALGNASVTSTGSWKATVTPRASGVLSAWFAGNAGQPAAVATAGPLSVGTWTPAVTLTAAAGQQLAGAGNRLSGSVSRSYAGVTTAAPGVPVRLYLQTTTGAAVLLGTASTTAAGTFTLTAAPAENGTLVARIVSVPGYADAASAGVGIAVTTRVAASGPTYVGTGLSFAMTATVTAARAAGVTLEAFDGSSWNAVASTTSSTTGIARFSVTAGAPGTYTYRMRVAGDGRGADGVSPNVMVTIR